MHNVHHPPQPLAVWQCIEGYHTIHCSVAVHCNTSTAPLHCGKGLKDTTTHYGPLTPFVRRQKDATAHCPHTIWWCNEESHLITMR